MYRLRLGKELPYGSETLCSRMGLLRCMGEGLFVRAGAGSGMTTVLRTLIELAGEGSQGQRSYGEDLLGLVA